MFLEVQLFPHFRSLAKTQSQKVRACAGENFSDITLGCCSVTKSCLTLFNPMDCSTPALPYGPSKHALPKGLLLVEVVCSITLPCFCPQIHRSLWDLPPRVSKDRIMRHGRFCFFSAKSFFSTNSYFNCTPGDAAVWGSVSHFHMIGDHERIRFTPSWGWETVPLSGSSRRASDQGSARLKGVQQLTPGVFMPRSKGAS